MPCRACEGTSLSEVLDLGAMPLAGDFRFQGDRNKLYPLAIDVCEGCGLLQVRETVNLNIIFHSNYSYASSTVRWLVQHFNDYALEMALSPELPRKKLLEVGCNDGIFLKPLSKVGYDVVGIDASENVALAARQAGLDTHSGLFNPESAKTLFNQYGYFDVITCSNVFAHNPNVGEFMEGVCALLEPQKGEFWVEVHSAHDLYEGLQWDCFYHEHCFYWTIHALKTFLKRYHLNLKQFKITPMHGGAIRAIFSKSNGEFSLLKNALTFQHWQEFGKRCLKSKTLIEECVHRLPIEYAYGAAGRAVTLINYANLQDCLDYVVDGSPLRYGKRIPNTNIPIISEEEFFQAPAAKDWCFITAHNYFEDIRKKMEKFFPRKTFKYLLPLPFVCIR